MPIFAYKLQKAYYEGGFFNVTVDYDRCVRQTEGPISLELGAGGRRIIGRINRHVHNNGTARIIGAELRRLQNYFTNRLGLAKALPAAICYDGCRHSACAPRSAMSPVSASDATKVNPKINQRVLTPRQFTATLAHRVLAAPSCRR